MRNISTKFVLIACVFYVNNVHSQSELGLPADFLVCKRNDPELRKCLLALTNEWTLLFREGIEALNMPPTDPLKLGRINFVYDNGFLKGVVALKKTEVLGISGMQVRNITIEFNGTALHVEEETFLPRLDVTAFYRADLRLAGVQLMPRGFLNLTLYNLTLFTKMHGHANERDNGYSYLRIDKMNSTTLLDLMHFNATGISSDPNTIDVTVDFVNKNWPQVYTAMAGETVRIWEPFVQKILNKFCDLAPLWQN